MYFLRWRFDFLDKAPKYGMWSNPGLRPEDKASFVNTTGIVRAAIEGKHVETREVKTLAECDGHDYVVFKWNASYVYAAANPSNGFTSTTGLKLVTREMELDVLPSGECVVSKRDNGEKTINYAAFGK